MPAGSCARGPRSRPAGHARQGVLPLFPRPPPSQDDIDTGRVLLASEGLAIIDGLNNDAPTGTTLQFVSGARGVLLWRRDDNLCYGLVVGGSEQVRAGEPVTCKVAGIYQV